MTDAHSDRPKNRETEDENLKPVGEGRPQRPATEPRGAEGSARSGKTRTDPASGVAIGNAEDPGPRSLRDTPKVG
jgi:hypothetical protein